MIDLHIDIFRRKFRTPFVLFNMGVYEYFPNDFNNDGSEEQDDLQLDIIDISYFTARTLCSYNLDHKELYFDIIASLLSHLNFIDPTYTNLLLSESRYKRLRDFSRSSRIGEMAQGINSYFVSKRLNFPYIIDFHLAKEKTINTLNIQSNGKSPDFVVLDSTMTYIGLFESKGNMNGHIKSSLISAKKQIDDVTNPCFNSKIPVSTRFQHNNNINFSPDRKSSINYELIKSDCVIESKEAQFLRKLHYASWFYLVGDFSRVNSILNDGNVLPIDANDPTYVLDIETDKGNPIYWVKAPLRASSFSKEYEVDLYLFIRSRYFRNEEFKIGIYKKVIDGIVKTNDSNTILEIPEGEISNLKKYPDGTLIFIRNTESN